MNSLKILLAGFFVLSALSFLNAQGTQLNLVLNGDFEDSLKCPNYNQEGIKCGKNWYSPDIASPNYFFPCNDTLWFKTYSTPKNMFGFLIPKSGKAYIGFGIAREIAGYDIWRESGLGALKNKLEGCKKYLFSAYINQSDSANCTISDLDVIFTDYMPKLSDDFIFSSKQNVNYLSKVHFDLSSKNIDTLNWTLLTDTLEAVGGESYLIITNTKLNSELQIVKFRPAYIEVFAYYYIDDVSLTELPDQELNIPNIITPNSDGLNDYFVIENLPANHELWVYNRWGNQVYYSNNYQNDWSPPDLSPGVYFYILSPPCGEPYKGTVTLVREK